MLSPHPIDFEQGIPIEIPAYQGRRDVVLDLDKQYQMEDEGELPSEGSMQGFSLSTGGAVLRTLSGRSLRPRSHRSTGRPRGTLR